MSSPQRLAMWVWYRGDHFRGFQRQPQGPTVQEALLAALAPDGVRGLVASGRTDRGVHARMQVVSARAHSPLPPEELLPRVRARLPEGLGLCALVSAPQGFHAQFSGVGKEYRYRLLLKGAGAAHPWADFAWSPAEHPRVARGTPAPERLAELLRAYEGEHDFIAFHEKSSARKARAVHAAQLVELGDGLFDVRLRASGFGRYQVRYMVGSAVAVAAGVLAEGEWREALATGAPMEGVKAPAHALVLWEVAYPPGLAPFAPALLEAAPTLPPRPPFFR